MSEYTPITADWLKENGYDGLVAPGECGCRLVELRACGFTPMSDEDDCLPAHEEPCTRCGSGNCMPSPDDPDAWCMHPGRRKEASDE